MLFGIYDVDGSGTLDYKEFSAAVFGRPSTAASQGARGGSAVQSAGGSRNPEALAE